MSSSLKPEKQASMPTAFPASGTFGVTQRVTLLSATPGATIHYTTDGSDPTPASAAFDPYVLPVLEAVNQRHKGITTAYTIKAISVKEGLEPSPTATFNYVIKRRSTDEYSSTEIRPGIHMIMDFDDTKMYLILGSKRAMLVDAGLGSGDLLGYVEKMIGDLPLDVIITHGHPDHIALMGQFQGKYNVYMNHIDIPLVNRFVEQMGYEIDTDQIIDLREGAAFDLGDRTFVTYEVPGHSLGSIVLFDEQSGILIAGDAVGSNRPTITDSLWMQFPGMAKIDEYLSTLQIFRQKIKGKVKEIYGGHNDVPFYGEAYLENLQRAAQALVDNGESALTPSLRPTDVWQVVVGDRLTDPNWAAINVAKDSCLTTPANEIAALSNLQINPGIPDIPFSPFQFNYKVVFVSHASRISIVPTAMSTKYSQLTINGESKRSEETYVADLKAGENVFEITVTAPNRTSSHTYIIKAINP